MAFWRKKGCRAGTHRAGGSSALTWRERTGAALGAAAEMLAGSAAIIGAPIAMVLGKFALALVLAAVALGTAAFRRRAALIRATRRHGPGGSRLVRARWPRWRLPPCWSDSPVGAYRSA